MAQYRVDSCDFHTDEQIRVAERPADVAALEKRLEETRSAVYSHEEIIDQLELRRLVPEIAKHCTAALIARGDGAAYPHRTLKSFLKNAEEAGVTIHENCGVSAIERVGSEWSVCAGRQNFIAPTVINTAGAWAEKIAAMIEDDIILGRKALMLMVTEHAAHFIKPVVSVIGRPLLLNKLTRHFGYWWQFKGSSRSGGAKKLCKLFCVCEKRSSGDRPFPLSGVTAHSADLGRYRSSD